jgi:ElaB/YqjD/DUF883 family membrane-anchored ribosome-binding protein
MSDMGASATGEREQGQGDGLTETVSAQATKAKDQGRRELRDQLDERTTQLGHQARSLAETLRRSGEEARSQGPDEVGVERIASGVADRLERAGGYLERASGDEMLRDAERFVRTRPWVVAGAAAAAGLLASRIFKASSERRYDESADATKAVRASSTRPNASQTYEGVPAGRQPVATGRAS